MNCPGCAFQNPDDARFCGECGSSLAVKLECPECGSENAPRQKFCNQCGARLTSEPAAADPRSFTPTHIADKITASAAALEGERKQVTVLFADVQGSMDLQGSVDAEVWRQVMNRLFALISEGVHRFEGTVDKFTGDGAMALFGAPIAHEDHARRACYAALHLDGELSRYAGEVRREHGLNFSVRMGLNSGEVVVGGVGDDLCMEYTAIGHTVGLAARMESLAEPGRPYLTEHTAALVEGWFELEDLGMFDVKGAQQPLGVYALTGAGSARTRLEAVGPRGLSRFVGRGEELANLESALERADRSGGQIVGVVAGPGLGKSRLCHEFTQLCAERNLQVIEGRGVAHGKRIPLLPVLEMLRTYFGISEHDDPRDARERVAGRLLLIDEDFRDALHIVFDFLGIADPDAPAIEANAEARQRHLFATLRHLSHVGSAQRRVVMIIEDLHWLDPGSEAFLEQLVDALPGTRNVMVVNFRPEYHADWMQKSYYEQMPLAPLGQEAIAELVRDLLGGHPSLDGLAELIADRTGGNPFFIEEVVRGLVESGSLEGRPGDYRLVRLIDDLAIPPTVHAVLDARIDRLSEREKRVLQSAAVIGKEFSEPVLRHVTGLPEQELSDVLGALRRAEFLYEKALYPETVYSFKHPLTEEVAYRSQLQERRRRTHAAVARAVEETYPDRLDERAALLANHWEQAGDWLRAARWNARAAWWAGQNHPSEALRHWRCVHALVRQEAGSNPEATSLSLGASLWILQLGWRTGEPGSELDKVYEEAVGLATGVGDKRALAGIKAAYAIAVGLQGRVEEAYRLGLEVHRLGDEVDEPALRIGGGPNFWLHLLGYPQEALDVSLALTKEHAGDFDMGRELVGFSPVIFGHMFRGGMVLPDLGRLAEARHELELALSAAREHNDVETLGWILGVWAYYAWVSGDVEGAVAKATEGVDIAERLGSSFSRVVAWSQLAVAHLACGNWDEAAAAAVQALDLMRGLRTGLQYEPQGQATLAEALIGKGDAAAAVRAARDGVAAARQMSMRTVEARCHLFLARALLLGDRPDPAAAARSLDRTDEIVRERGAVVLAPHIRLARAELAGLEGDEAAREHELREAHRLFVEHGATGRAGAVAAELDALGAATG